HLARHSDYFKNLFFKNYADSQKDIIPLEEVVPADAFQHFLELISGGNRLNDEVIEEVLKISQMWFAEVPLEKAKDYLLKKSNLVPMEKFIIAEKYNFSDLKNALFANVETVADMNALLPNQEVSDFEPETTTLIAKRLLEISGIPRPIPAAPVAPEPPAEIPVAPVQNIQEGIIAFLQQELHRTREEAERERMRSDRIFMASKRSANQMEDGSKDSEETPSKKFFDFSEDIDSELYDGVLQVEGRLFYVMKGHLARHSDYFKNLFFKNYADSKKEVITLKDVVPADAFQHFLELISGGNRLNDEVIEEVLKISQMWFAEVPLEKAKEYLLKKSNLAPMEKFIIAEKYNFSDLKNALFANVQTVADMNALLPNQDVSDFEPDTTTLIAKRLLEISGIPRPIPVARVAPEPPAEIVPVAPDRAREALRREIRRRLQEISRHLDPNLLRDN
ncbi:hypothetical protein B9Z55_029157, partial [Caenorhabditis nigoni]